MSVGVTLTPGQIPVGWCFSTYQDLLNTIINNTTAYIAGTAMSFNFGSAIPNADQRGVPWIKTDSNYNPERLYTWSTQYSLWLALHPTPPGIVVMTSTDITAPYLDTFDGGAAGGVTAIAGPMWEKYTAMDNRSPMAPGTWADTTTVLALGATAGEQKHILTVLELANHAHTSSRDYDAPTTAAGAPRLYGGHHFTGIDQPNIIADGGGDTGHNTVHPVLGINFIRRTARLFYRAV